MKNLRRLLALLIIVTLPIFVGAKGCNLFGGEEEPPVTLEVWGVFDDELKLKPFVNEFEKIYPNIKIAYSYHSVDTYEKDIINEFAAGRGPDVWMIHNTWLPKHQDKIRPFTAEELPVLAFSNLFADIATENFTADNLVYGVPLYIDSLALIYNRDILQSVGLATPPATWAQFNDAVQTITRYNNVGNLERSAAAIGAAANVNRAADLLSILMLQEGTTMTSTDKTRATFAETDRNVRPEVNHGEKALRYLTDFSNPSKSVYTWDLAQDNSIDAFIAGKTAMLFNYSYALEIIKERAPRLNVSVTELPQIDANTSNRITFANYWALAMTKNTDAPAAANTFIQFLAGNNAEALAIDDDGTPLGKEVNKRYLETFGRPAARKDLITYQQQSDPLLGPIAKQNLVAKTWYIVDDVSYENIFNNMIDDIVLARASFEDALRKASDRYTQLLQTTADNRARAGLNSTL